MLRSNKRRLSKIGRYRIRMIQKSNIPERALKYSHKESILSFTQKSRTYTAVNKNKKQVLGFWVDDNLITSLKTKKCDCAIIIENNLCYLIELKGESIEEACEQLNVTLEYFKSKYQMQKFVCRIVISRFNTHKVRNEKYISLAKKLRILQKQFGLQEKTLWIKENKLQESV